MRDRLMLESTAEAASRTDVRDRPVVPAAAALVVARGLAFVLAFVLASMVLAVPSFAQGPSTGPGATPGQAPESVSGATMYCELEAQVVQVFGEDAAPEIAYDHALVARVELRRLVDGDAACGTDAKPGTTRVVGLSGNVQSIENGSLVSLEVERLADGSERWRVIRLEPPDTGSPLVLFAIIFVGLGVLIFGGVVVVLLRSRGRGGDHGQE